MEANYKIDEEVVFSGTLTGIGDVKGIIAEVGSYTDIGLQF